MADKDAVAPARFDARRDTADVIARRIRTRDGAVDDDANDEERKAQRVINPSDSTSLQIQPDSTTTRAKLRAYDSLVRSHEEVVSRLTASESRNAALESQMRVLTRETLDLQKAIASARVAGGDGSASDSVNEAYGKLKEAMKDLMDAREEAARAQSARGEAERAMEAATEAKERFERRARESEKALASSRKAEAQALSNKGGTHRVALSHDGFSAACAGEDKVVAIFDTATGARTSELLGCLGGVLDVSFSADDTLVLGASTDCSLQLWEALTGRVKHRLTGHAQQATSAQISQTDAKRAISASRDRTLKTWDLVRGLATTSMLTASTAHSVLYGATERHAFSGHFDGSVRVWDLRANQVEKENKVHAGPITSIVAMPSENEVLTNSRDNCLKLVDVRMMEVVRNFSSPKYRVGTDWSNPCAAPDGQHIAAGGSDGGLFIWRVQDGRLMTTLHGHDAVVASCSWSSSGMLASADKNGVCLLWE
ncbi:WD40-repeat-containing domain protein [Ostreococcus tauri]|uniref:WD40-repeat-containing domain protein n=1 Tax=Ostreococcus tauri TaxID=70448 RepID=A0A1Y5I0E9_OSTTA|nr:WD40-repeat-containing domain protein [Ostreococcus tauri]